VLPPAKVGQPYHVEFGTEGDQPASWSLLTALVARLPAFRDRSQQFDKNQIRQRGQIVLLGLEFDREKGLLTGKPQVPGNYMILVQAGHSYGRLADTRTYVLRIEP
jgi:hypothetical protein